MEYGVTEKGFVLKRFDTILAEVQGEISAAAGFDVSQNPQSLLNSALLYPFCDKIAALWEVAQDNYYSMYPATAEGINLDNAVQYGNIFRKPNVPTEYVIHVTAQEGVNGEETTVIPKGSLISSITSPVVRLKCGADTVITRSRCNRIAIKPVITTAGTYRIALGTKMFSYTAASATTEEAIVDGLFHAFSMDGYTAEIVVENSGEYLLIKDSDLSRINEFELTNNLTTVYVVTPISYFTEDYGDIQLPKETITVITSNVTGLISVINLLDPKPGQLEQTDVSLRQDYIKKSYASSDTQTESVESYVLDAVSGIKSVRCYENDSNVTDEYGRPPHSIEAIVDGGDSADIAAAILKKKAAGIYTYGEVSVDVTTEYGDVVPVRFNRPEIIYAWIDVTLTQGRTSVDPDFEVLVKEYIVEQCKNMTIGDNLLSQKLINGIYEILPGITFCKIEVGGDNTTEHTRPSEMEEGNIECSQRQKIEVADTRIGVVLQ